MDGATAKTGPSPKVIRQNAAAKVAGVRPPTKMNPINATPPTTRTTNPNLRSRSASQRPASRVAITLPTKNAATMHA